MARIVARAGLGELPVRLGKPDRQEERFGAAFGPSTRASALSRQVSS